MSGYLIVSATKIWDIPQIYDPVRQSHGHTISWHQGVQEVIGQPRPDWEVNPLRCVSIYHKCFKNVKVEI